MILALALATWEVVTGARRLREGEYSWPDGFFLLLYSVSAILLARDSKAGPPIALVAGVTAISLRVWTVWSVLLSPDGLAAGSVVESLAVLAENLVIAACNVLLIQDAFAKPLAGASAGGRLSRFRELPGWKLLSAHLVIGLALLCFAALGGPDQWRYGRISTALFGTALVVHATSMVLAKLADVVGSYFLERRAAR